jgi:hypothetical protein
MCDGLQAKWILGRKNPSAVRRTEFSVGPPLHEQLVCRRYRGKRPASEPASTGVANNNSERLFNCDAKASQTVKQLCSRIHKLANGEVPKAVRQRYVSQLGASIAQVGSINPAVTAKLEERFDRAVREMNSAAFR